jgi:hypothetical protein
MAVAPSFDVWHFSNADGSVRSAWRSSSLTCEMLIGNVPGKNRLVWDPELENDSDGDDRPARRASCGSPATTEPDATPAAIISTGSLCARRRAEAAGRSVARTTGRSQPAPRHFIGLPDRRVTGRRFEDGDEQGQRPAAALIGLGKALPVRPLDFCRQASPLKMMVTAPDSYSTSPPWLFSPSAPMS